MLCNSNGTDNKPFSIGISYINIAKFCNTTYHSGTASAWVATNHKNHEKYDTPMQIKIR